MKFDIFFSICQTEVDGYMPGERVMFENFFDQFRLADALGFGTAWVAETHLSCQVQKQNPGAVIPHFKGEIGLNTDILQLAHKVFAMTRRINIGSAIRNIICNGGPVAHAEAVRTFMTYHGMDRNEKRLLELGFAQGRFPFSNIPYGFSPRNAVEQAAWPALRGQIFMEAVEIFLRCLKGEVISSDDIAPKKLSRKNFRSDDDWHRVLKAHGKPADEITFEPFWKFPKVGVIPFDAPLDLLRLTLGSHDPAAQNFANTILPCGVFNLSITPVAEIEEVNTRMAGKFHPAGGPWKREYMPRTVLVFVNNDRRLTEAQQRAAARQAAEKALANYWVAIEGTLDPLKVSSAVDNALSGTVQDVKQQMKERFHKDDRLMLWFDFNNHDNEAVKTTMRTFMEHVAPEFA